MQGPGQSRSGDGSLRKPCPAQGSVDPAIGLTGVVAGFAQTRWRVGHLVVLGPLLVADLISGS